MGCGASVPAYSLEKIPDGLQTIADAAAAGGAATASVHSTGGGGTLSTSANNSVQAQYAPAATSRLDPKRPVTILNFEKGRSDFIMRDIIGKGGKSVGVQVGFHPKSRGYYAIKFINEGQAASEHWEVQPADELKAMKTVTLARVPFVTPLRGWFEENGTLALVMGYMPGGELFSRMCGHVMGADEAAFYLSEVVLALEGMHALGFIYRDLKPENILLDDQGHLALCDMGFAVQAERAYKRLGTPQYQAPEILAADVGTIGYTAAVDWWALGCLMFEMMSGHAAFGEAHTRPEEVFAKVLSPTGGPNIPGSLPRTARDLIRGLLQRDPAQRIATAGAVKAHPFFAKVDWAAAKDKRYMSPWIPPPMRFPGDVANFDIYLRMEGQTVVARGAAARIIYEKPLPKGDSILKKTSASLTRSRNGSSASHPSRANSKEPGVAAGAAGTGLVPAGGDSTATAAGGAGAMPPGSQPHLDAAVGVASSTESSRNSSVEHSPAVAAAPAAGAGAATPPVPTTLLGGLPTVPALSEEDDEADEEGDEATPSSTGRHAGIPAAFRQQAARLPTISETSSAS